MRNLPYANKMPYFRTGKSAADTWLEKVKVILRKAGATDIRTMFLDQDTDKKAAYLISFHLEGDEYRQTWPILKVRNDDEVIAAKVQAATAMYHSIKAKVTEIQWRGARATFGGDLVVVPNGPTVAETDADFRRQLPALLLPGKGE